jgi:dCTP deaminase
MLLSNTAIREAIDDGRLAIEPLDECGFDATAINLTLSPIIQVPYAKYPTAIRFGQGDIKKMLEESSTVHTITNDQPFELKPNTFVLGTTEQAVWFKGPEAKVDSWQNRPVLAGRVEGKSSFARIGLVVHFTAPTIHNTFRGRITLEMMNFGVYSIMLTLDRPICQLLVEEVLGSPTNYVSEFQGQRRPAGTS